MEIPPVQTNISCSSSAML